MLFVSELFRLPPKITSLNLSHNQLQVLPVEHISNASSLQELDISSNSLETFDDALVSRIKNHKLRVHFDGKLFSFTK